MLDIVEVLLERGPHPALGTIALNGTPYGSACREPKARNPKVIGGYDENKKRVGIRLTSAPHPLEVGRAGEPVFAVHPPFRVRPS